MGKIFHVEIQRCVLMLTFVLDHHLPLSGAFFLISLSLSLSLVSSLQSLSLCGMPLHLSLSLSRTVRIAIGYSVSLALLTSKNDTPYQTDILKLNQYSSGM